MLDWLKNNLYNRWSFNFLIWQGIRVVLRIVILDLLCKHNNPICTIPLPLMLAYQTYDFFIISPTILLFILENKFGFRINQKFFKSNFAFVSYILLSIPALIIEIIYLSIVLFFYFATFLDYLANPNEIIDSIKYFFSLDGLSIFFVWFF